MGARRFAVLGVALLMAALALPEVGRAQTSAHIRLWLDGAPGSAHWVFPEQVVTGPSGDRVVSNVSDPTLSVFLPDPELATGAAVVIAPGGALRALSMDNEGVRVAEWLNWVD